MKYIDLDTWPRLEAFLFFSQISNPFYAVTFPLDVTEVKRTAKAAGLSFYHTMIWVCTKAVNSVEAFRIRVRGEKLVLLDRTDPSFTDLRPGAEQFHIVSLPWQPTLRDFCRSAAEKSAAQHEFLVAGEETDGLIYFSCTPWFDFTSLTNEHSADTDDTVPRIAWGKYYEENGRLMLHVSVEVNHRTIDGMHLGRLKEALDTEIARLAETVE